MCFILGKEVDLKGIIWLYYLPVLVPVVGLYKQWMHTKIYGYIQYIGRLCQGLNRPVKGICVYELTDSLLWLHNLLD